MTQANEKYCGDVILQKTFVESPLTKKVKQNNGELEKYLVLNNHEALVSRDIFQQVQEEIARRSSKPKISKNTKGAKGAYRGKYALTEILICGDCGTPYRRVVWTKRNGIKQPVWRCIKHIEYGDKYCKDAPNIDEEALHEAIMKAMVKGAGENTLPMLKNEVRLALLKDATGKVDVEMLEKRIEELRETAMKMLTDNCLNDSMSKVEKQIEAISNEMKNLQIQIDEYKEKLNSTDKFETVMTAIDQHMETTDIMEYDDKLVRQAIHTIKVINENTIKIYFHTNQVITQQIDNKIRKLKSK